MKGIFVVLLLTSMLCAAQDTSKQAAPKPWDKFLGSWKRVPGPDDSTGLKVEPESDGIKFSFGCKQDGSCSDTNVVHYDGKPYKDSLNAVWESSFRKTGDRTLQEDEYIGGKLGRTIRWQLSPDGNTLTRTFHTIIPPGSKDFFDIDERNGGPVSKGDPFIGFWKRDWNKSDADIITYTDKGDVFTFTSTGLTGSTNERNCDGKDHTFAGLFYNCNFPDDRTYELAFKQNGKVYMTRISKVSEDEKTMVRFDKEADGKLGSQLAYEKIK